MWIEVNVRTRVAVDLALGIESVTRSKPKNKTKKWLKREYTHWYMRDMHTTQITINYMQRQ